MIIKKKSKLALAAILAGFVSATTAYAGDCDVTVSSKGYSEQLLIGNMAALLLEDIGATVDRKIGLGGTMIVHEAFKSGEVDMYMEYTATGLLAILKKDPIKGRQKVWDAVKSGYADQLDSTWLRPWGFNNTYVLTMKKTKADELGVETISDLIAVAGQLKFGSTPEFAARPDGLPGLQNAYQGLEFGDSLTMASDLLTEAVADGQIDVGTDGATNGLIPELGLITIKDDREFFLPYDAAPVLRNDFAARCPAAAEALSRPAGKIDDTMMANLNYEVEGKNREPEDVAREFLKAQGWIQ